MKNLPPIDLLSFWLGFILATLFWLVLNRIIKLLPKLKRTLSQRREANKLDLHSDVEARIRKFILRDSQSTHLGSLLFPLNKISVPLGLVGFPSDFNPDLIGVDEPSIYRLLPDLTDFPELSSHIPFPIISIEQALSGANNLAIQGEIGSGKTTLLSQFAIRVIESHDKNDQLHGYLPIKVHAFDLINIDGSESGSLAGIARILSSRLNNASQQSISDNLAGYAKSGKLILLIDGLEELTPTQFEKAVNLIHLLQDENSLLRFVVTIGPNYSDGLYELGFEQFRIQPFTSELKRNLMINWISALGELPKYQLGPINQFNDFIKVAELWLAQETAQLSIFDFTMRMLSCLFPGKSALNQNFVNNYLCSIVGDDLSFSAFLEMSIAIKESDYHGLTRKILFDLIEQDLIRLKQQRTLPPQQESTELNLKMQEAVSETNSPNSLITKLLDNHVLVERTDGHITFENPSVLAYLCANSENQMQRYPWQLIVRDPFMDQVLRFSDDPNAYRQEWLAGSDPVLYQNITQFILHIKSNPLLSFDRHAVFPKIISLTKNHNLPLGLKIKLFSIFYFTKDASIYQLLDMYKTSDQPELRCISAFYYGLLRRSQDLTDLANDPNQSVINYSIFGLTHIWDSLSQKTVISLLLNGSEKTRAIVAELLAGMPFEGHEIIKEVSEVDDIVSRKAIVGGIRMVNEPWAKSLLEKISLEDSQWIVRDAAIHALEHPISLVSFYSRKKPLPSEAAWLIKYASQKGLGLESGSYPYSLLFDVLENGDLEERRSALAYLSLEPNQSVIEKLIYLMKTDQHLRDAAYQYLLELSYRGIEL